MLSGSGDLRGSEETVESSRIIIKALPMTVPEIALRHNAEKKRIKKGILSDSAESSLFEKILYLPYLDFTYQYPATRGLLSKQSILSQGRSVVLALREVDLGFYPELSTLANQLTDVESGLDNVVPGVDSTVLVSERLEDLKAMLSGYDNELRELSEKYESLPNTDPAKQDLKDAIEHLKKTRDIRWKIFSDGLKLPSRVQLEKIELLEGNLFYIPYYVVRFSRGGESRFLVWRRDGTEDEVIEDEMMKNAKFRDLVQSYTAENGSSVSVN